MTNRNHFGNSLILETFRVLRNKGRELFYKIHCHSLEEGWFLIHLVLFLLDVIFLRDFLVVKLAYVVKMYVVLLGFLHVVSRGVMDFFLFFVSCFLGFCCVMCGCVT